MRCQSCGSDQSDSSSFCENCGSKLTKPETGSINNPFASTGSNQPSNPFIDPYQNNPYGSPGQHNPFANPGQNNPYGSSGQHNPWGDPYQNNSNRPFSRENNPNYKSGKATASLILGIISLICAGFIFGIIAISLGIGAQKELRNNGAPKSGAATAGIVLGILGIIGWVIAIIFYFS